MTGRGAALVTGGAVGGSARTRGWGARPRPGRRRPRGRAAAAALARPSPSVPAPRGAGRFRFGSDFKEKQTLLSRTQVVASKRHREAPPAFVTADSGFGGGFKDDEKENKKARVANAAPSKPKPPTENAFVAMEEDDDFDADLDALSAVERARAVAKAMKPYDPNAFRRATKAIRASTRRPPPSAWRRRRSLAWRPRRPSRRSPRPSRGPSRGRGDAPRRRPVPPRPTAFSAAFGDVAAAHADGASRYAASAEALERDRLLARLSHLEERDRLHTQVAETHVLRVKCSMCECGALFERRPRDSCARAGHRARPHETKKRFFKCGACPFRVATLGKPFPPTPCPRCRCEDWDKCGMSAAAERTKAGAGFGEDVGNRREYARARRRARVLAARRRRRRRRRRAPRVRGGSQVRARSRNAGTFRVRTLYDTTAIAVRERRVEDASSDSAYAAYCACSFDREGSYVLRF